jgi:signal transduction histidine kinase
MLRSVEFDLKESLSSAFNLVHVLLLDKDVKMSYSIEDGIPRLKGDLVRLEHILTNLMENAVKYTDKGEIIVKAQRVLEGCFEEKCRVKFSVKDSGLGIPQESIGQIFDAYTRFHEFAGGKDRGGTGLGLYIVKTMVDMMGGTISVVSEVGVGSEFIVTLDFDIVR